MIELGSGGPTGVAGAAPGLRNGGTVAIDRRTQEPLTATVAGGAVARGSS